MASAPQTWADAKTSGNAEFASGNMQRAIELYSLALELGASAAAAALLQAAPAADAPPPLTDADRAVVLSNRAQCHLKVGSPEALARAVADCSAALTLQPAFLKAQFRRAAALEALRDHRAAIADYRAVLKLQPDLRDAAAGERRCAAALGEAPPPGGGSAAAPGARGARPPGAGGAAGLSQMQLSDEDRRNLEEAQTRVKDVYRQKLKAGEQLRIATQEKRRAELTLSQLQTLPSDGAGDGAGGAAAASSAATPPRIRTFRGLGRIFVRTPRDDIVRELSSQATHFEQKHKVCVATLDYLTKQEEEASKNFLETSDAIRKRIMRS